MSLEQELQQKPVTYLDLSNFTRVEIGMSVKTAVERMRADKRQCAIIMDEDALVGIFTERDVLLKIVDDPESWSRPIDDFMTPEPMTVQSIDPADVALALMDDYHIRNVPVLDETGQVIGTLTDYAIIKCLAGHFSEQA